MPYLYYCGSVTQESRFKLAALASAVMPELQFVGTRQSEQSNTTDADAHIDHAVVQDVSGRLYDIFASDNTQGRKRLHDRARAAWALEQTRGLSALGFAHDTMVLFSAGNGSASIRINSTASSNTLEPQAAHDNLETGVHTDPSPVGDDDALLSHQSKPQQQQHVFEQQQTVLIAKHLNGSARDLNLLTLEDAANVGTAIGAIHRLNPTFMEHSGYPSFTTGQIRTQLTGWIKRLRQAGHIPSEITNSWSQVLETEGLWSFTTCPVHGGFHDGDLLFSGSTVTAITNWQGMQINDPARDLAWIFAKLDEAHRNALMSAYGRILGSRLDSLIMLRANLWLQMEQVGDFIQALAHADTTGIMRFKAQVERLAHELTRIRNTSQAKRTVPQPNASITVSTILRDTEHSADVNDATNEHDVTLESMRETLSDTTSERNVPLNDETHDHQIQPAYSNTHEQSTSTTKPLGSVETSTQVIVAHEERAPHEDTLSTGTQHVESTTQTATQSITTTTTIGTDPVNDHTDDALEVHDAHTLEDHDDTSPATVIIPLLEREERAMRDAQAGLVADTHE